MLGHGSALVVASQHYDFARVADLEGVQEDAHLDGKAPSVDVVPQEKHVGPK